MHTLQVLCDTRFLKVGNDITNIPSAPLTTSYSVVKLIQFEEGEDANCNRCGTYIPLECIAVQMTHYFSLAKGDLLAPLSDRPSHYCRNCCLEPGTWSWAGTVWHNERSLTQDYGKLVDWEKLSCGPYCAAIHLTWCPELVREYFKKNSARR